MSFIKQQRRAQGFGGPRADLPVATPPLRKEVLPPRKSPDAVEACEFFKDLLCTPFVVIGAAGAVGYALTCIISGS